MTEYIDDTVIFNSFVILNFLLKKEFFPALIIVIVIVIVIVIYCKYVEFTKNNTRVYNTKKITDNIKII